MVGKFKAAKNLSIDEQLLLWKGRLGFKQYISNKRSRFGIKIFSLCELSEYLWNSFVYLGKEAIMSNDEQEYIKLGKSGAVGPKLMADLYGKGYHLYVDNWYITEKLFRHLEDNGTAACGTAMGHRLTVPKSMKEKYLSNGEYTYRRDDNTLMIGLKDKKEIYFLSTIHNTAVSNTNKKNKDGEIVSKVTLVQDYNKNMVGVDGKDALISNHTSVRKSLKWTTKVALHFIEEAILNAFILFNKA